MGGPKGGGRVRKWRQVGGGWPRYRGAAWTSGVDGREATHRRTARRFASRVLHRLVATLLVGQIFTRCQRGSHFPREPVEMPVRDTPIHILCKANNIAAILQAACEEVLQINPADRGERAVAPQGPGQRPQQEEAVGQCRQVLAFARFRADGGAATQVLLGSESGEVSLQNASGE